jgi:hypothetical protein
MPTMWPTTSRQPDKRIRETTRAGVVAGLIRSGIDAEVADHWCELWETEAVRQGMTRHGTYFWDAAKGWIDAHRSSTMPLG